MWGLNVGYGSGDDPQMIAENRRRAIEAVLPGASLATVHQIHSPTVVQVEQPWHQDQRPHADAMVTDRPGILLGVLTADCAPVLFADQEASVVGRGAFRLARSHRRRQRGDDRGDGEAWSKARADRGRGRAERRAEVLRSRRGVPRALRRTGPGEWTVLRCRARGQAALRSYRLHSPAPERCGHRRSARPCGSTPIPTRTVSTAIGGQPTGMSRRTVARSA